MPGMFLILCAILSKFFTQVFGFFCYDQTELMWLGHEVPDRSPLELLGELHFPTLTAKSDHFHKALCPQSPFCSLQYLCRSFYSPKCFAETGQCFKLSRSCTLNRPTHEHCVNTRESTVQPQPSLARQDIETTSKLSIFLG